MSVSRPTVPSVQQSAVCLRLLSPVSFSTCCPASLYTAHLGVTAFCAIFFHLFIKTTHNVVFVRLNWCDCMFVVSCLLCVYVCLYLVSSWVYLEYHLFSTINIRRHLMRLENDPETLQNVLHCNILTLIFLYRFVTKETCFACLLSRLYYRGNKNECPSEVHCCCIITTFIENVA